MMIPGSLVHIIPAKYLAVKENLVGWIRITSDMLGVYLLYKQDKQSSLVLFTDTKVWIPDYCMLSLVDTKETKDE